MTQPDETTATPTASDERWPAWLVDTAIATGVSVALLAAMAAVGGAATGIVAYVLGWHRRQRANGRTPSVADVRRLLTPTGSGNQRQPENPEQRFAVRIRQRIGDVLKRGAYPQGWAAGERSARAALPYAGARVPRGVKLSVDWEGWTPGDWQAARKLVDAQGDASGFRTLLDEAGIQISRIADNRLDEVAKCLADGLESGATPQQLARDLQATLEDPDWAMTVAWTETSRAIAAAAEDQYRQAGIRSKGWMTALDQRVCPRCMADEVAGFIDIDSTFPSGARRPPGHPRCRCALMPGPVSEEDEMVMADKTVVPDLVKDFDPDQPRDDHGRWSKIGAALHAITEAAGASVVGHEVFGGEEGFSDSHGIVVAHPGGDYSIALHDKDVGTHHVMVLPDDDAREELRAALDDIWTAHRRDPTGSGSVEADDGSWQVEYNEHGAMLHANLDADSDQESVLLSHEDVETLETALSNVGDALRHAESPDYTAPLAPGEEVRPGSRKRLGSVNDGFVGAVEVIDTPNGPRVRLGTIAQGDDGIKSWTGGRGKTTVDLDEASAAKIADVLERMDANGKERQKIYDRHITAAEARGEAGEDVDWWQVDADVRAELPEALDETDSSSAWEDAYGAELIDTPWGTVRLTDTGMDDEANAGHRYVRMDIWPSGMTEEEYDEGNPDHASWAWPGSEWQKPSSAMQAKDVRALIRVLRGSFGEDVTKGARPGQRRSSWEHQWKYGKLRKKWIGHPHPWTELERHLSHHMPEEEAKRTAAQWFKDVFGIWPGERKGDNPVGPG